MFMPAFEHYPNEAAIIARILGGYGELEFLLAVCLGHALDDTVKGVRAIFRNRGETSRINLADALMADAFEQAGLKAEYADALGAMRYSLKIRNWFSHCHWADLDRPDVGIRGLFYVELGKAADTTKYFEYQWMHADLPLLKEMEDYCAYARMCFIHLDMEWPCRMGKMHDNPLPMPIKRVPPTQRIVQEPRIRSLLPKGLGRPPLTP